MRYFIEPGGDRYIPFARNRIGALERVRELANVPFLQRAYDLGDGVSVHVRTHQEILRAQDFIRIQVTSLGQMLFARRNGDIAEVFAYDYINQKLAQLSPVSVQAGGLGLVPFHNTRSHLTDPTGSAGYINTLGIGADLVFEEEVSPSPVFLAYRTDRVTGREYAVAMEGSRPIVYSRIPGGSFRKVIIFPARTAPKGQTFKWAIEDGDDARAFGISGGAIYLSGTWVGKDLWNLFNGYEFLWYNPALGTAGAYQWFSNFGFAEPAEFGSVGVAWTKTYGPFVDAYSEFGALLDDKAGEDGPGHCELLVSSVEAPAGNSAGEALRLYCVNSKNTDDIPAPIFDLSDDIPSLLSLSRNYDYWAPLGEISTARAEGGEFCVLLSSQGGEWVFIDYPGYLRRKHVGTGYKFHTVSEDGNLLFVVHEVAGVESGILFDLLTDTASTHVSIQGFETGCFIPLVDTDQGQISVLSTIEDVDTVTLDPALGEVRPGISDPITKANDHWKIECVDGFTAHAYLWRDECWFWTATAVRPSSNSATVSIEGEEYNVFNAPYIIGGTYDNEILFGKFTKNVTDISTEGIPVSPILGISYIKPYEAPAPSIESNPLGWPQGTVECVDCTPPVNWSGATPYSPGSRFATQQDAGCSTLLTVSIVDDCGRTASKDIDIPPPPALSITGTDAPIVGDSYTAFGGVAPYTFSISCGTIDASSGTITDLTGCCGSGTVTVEDACDQSAQITVRFPLGTWNLTNTEGPYGTCSGPTSFSSSYTEYFGDTRVDTYLCGDSTSEFGCDSAFGTIACCNNCSKCSIYTGPCVPVQDGNHIYKTSWVDLRNTFVWECT